MSSESPRKSTEGRSGFTVRAVLIAIGIALFLLMSTSYIAVKLGAVPWPIIFSVIVTGGIIKVLSRKREVNIHEVNVAQAGASIGGLIAAGIMFTIPGIIYLNQTQNLNIALPDPWQLGIMTAIAGLLAILLSVPLKYTFIDEEQLPYPSGTAGAELLKLGKTGGTELVLIILIGAAAGIFALLRDIYFAAALTSSAVFLTIIPLPLAVGGGYILGPRPGFSWFIGAFAGWMILVPVLYQKGFNIGSARELVQNLGMGVVLGAGVSFFVSYIIPRVKKIFLPLFNAREKWTRLFPLLAVMSVIVLIVIEVPILAAFLTVLGVWIMVAVAARMTGETNIDPLEQFGIFIALVIALIYKYAALELTMFALFMIVTFVSVACAIAGDAGHDYKSAAIVGTRFFDVVKVDLITVIFAGLAAPFVFDIIYRGFSQQFFTTLIPAPQAQLVAGSIFGFRYPGIFFTGFGIGFVAEIVNSFLPARYKNQLLWMPLGIGLFLGLGLALPILLGALIRFYMERRRENLIHAGLLVAAGIMGGEGIAGFGAGAITIAGIGYETGAQYLIFIFVLIILLALVFNIKSLYKNK
jgi:uncharacterized oligopeptide transporter (OPT) family protein